MTNVHADINMANNRLQVRSELAIAVFAFRFSDVHTLTEGRDHAHTHKQPSAIHTLT